VVFTLACTSAATSSAAPTALGDCSHAAAQQAVASSHLGDPNVTDPIFKVLCGAFTGSGSQTMAATLFGPGNIGLIDWVVFRWSGTAWTFVMVQHRAAELSAAGPDIRETVHIYRPTDPRCCPSGGTRSRLWHWNGTQFVAGAWKGPKTGPLTSAEFFSPLPGGIACSMVEAGGPSPATVYCQSTIPHGNARKAHSARLSLSGRFTRCLGIRCVGDPGEGTPTLAFGKQRTVGRFRCFSLHAGVKCVVIRTGKGFLFNAAGTTRVG